MYVASVPNRSSPPAILLRESYREGGKVRNRTLANLSSLPAAQVEAIRCVLKGETLVPAGQAFEIERSLPHGHVAAALGMLRQCGLERLLGSKPSRERDLVAAMIVARVIDPRPKLATARVCAGRRRATRCRGRWVWATSRRTSCTTRWTGLWGVRIGFRTRWPSGICGTGRWCSTTRAVRTSRAARVRWRSGATAATIAPTVRRSCMA